VTISPKKYIFTEKKRALRYIHPLAAWDSMMTLFVRSFPVAKTVRLNTL